MRLRELEPEFLRRDMRACRGDALDRCGDTSPHREHVDLQPVGTIEAADGVLFLCPKCWLTNGGPVGTHSVLCWRPRVAADVAPKPGRWEFEGSSLDDLTLVAAQSSVQLTSGCNAHFYVRRGDILKADPEW